VIIHIIASKYFIIKGNIEVVFEAVSGPFCAKNYCYLGDFVVLEKRQFLDVFEAVEA
jgi:hypothetical protein